MELSIPMLGKPGEGLMREGAARFQPPINPIREAALPAREIGRFAGWDVRRLEARRSFTRHDFA